MWVFQREILKKKIGERKPSRTRGRGLNGPYVRKKKDGRGQEDAGGKEGCSAS